MFLSLNADAARGLLAESSYNLMLAYINQSTFGRPQHNMKISILQEIVTQSLYSLFMKW